MVNVKGALKLVRARGAVLATGKGEALCLAEAIVGEPIRGSWWAHPKSRQIFAVLGELSESPDILVCRLIAGKITLVHRRLWPALVKLANQFQRAQLAQVRQEHTPAGHHVVREIAFPEWVPRAVLDESRGISEQRARRALGEAVMAAASRARRTSTPSRRRKHTPGH